MSHRLGSLSTVDSRKLCVPVSPVCRVSSVNTFNNQSEWVLTKRTEQGLEVLLLWVAREQGDTPGLGEHLLSSIIDLDQYCNEQSDVW